MSSFPILMYHALNKNEVDEYYTLTEQAFRRQMSLIRELGFHGTSLGNLLSSDAREGERAVVISFDDGHASDRSIALPILHEFDYTATFFITTMRIGTASEWMDWADVEALKTAGMDIQAHGHTHKFLSGLEETQQEEELRRPREVIREKLSTECNGFSFPGGRYDTRSIELARRLGYTAICTSEPGLNRQAAGDFQILKRFVVHQGLGERAFQKIVTRDTVYSARANLPYRAKRALKRLLGDRTYHRIWSYLFAGRSS